MCNSKRLKSDEIIEGIDFNWELVNGVKIRVFTREYLKAIRVKCCDNNCKNCPWKISI